MVGSSRTSRRTAVVLSSPYADTGLPLRGRSSTRFPVSSSLFLQSRNVDRGGAGLLNLSVNLRRLDSIDSFSKDIIHAVIVTFSLRVYSMLELDQALKWRYTFKKFGIFSFKRLSIQMLIVSKFNFFNCFYS